MCGIWLTAGLSQDAGGQLLPPFLPQLVSRGPDQLQAQALHHAPSGLHLTAAASLLQLRGTAPTTNPHVDAAGNLLAFNGEVFGGLQGLAPGGNDGAALLAALGRCRDAAGITRLLSQLEGPWALLYWHAASSTLWLGRDVLGRRSLLVHSPTPWLPLLLVTSVGPPPVEAAPPSSPPTTATTTTITTNSSSSSAVSGDTSIRESLSEGSKPTAGSLVRGASGHLGEVLQLWELPPGLYSITAAGLAAALAECAAGAQAAAAVAAAAAALPSVAAAGQLSGAPQSAGGQPSGQPQQHQHGSDAQQLQETSNHQQEGQQEQQRQQQQVAGTTGPGPGQVPPWWLAHVTAHPWQQQRLRDIQQYERDPGDVPDTAASQQKYTAGTVRLQESSPQTDTVEPEGGGEAGSEDPALQAAAQQAMGWLQEAVAVRCHSLDMVQGLEEVCNNRDDRGPGSVGLNLQQQQQPVDNHSSPAEATTPDVEAVGAPAPTMQQGGWRQVVAMHGGRWYTQHHDPAQSHNQAQEQQQQQQAQQQESGSACTVVTTEQAPLGNTFHLCQGSWPKVAPGQLIDLGQPRIPGVAGTGPSAPVSPLLPAAPILLLFSGGVDSTLLAVLAHRSLPSGVPIDLVNVCFDRGRSPDRLAALDALEELRAVAPDRCWRLILVNSSLAEVDALSPHLRALLAPAATLMDLNIGAALWLAARAVGVLHDTCSETPASSSTTAVAAGCSGSSSSSSSSCRDGVGSGRVDSSSCNGGGSGSTHATHTTTAATTNDSRSVVQRSDTEGAAGVAGGLVCSTAPVVLLGHGADEQCGGYGRHRTAFRTGGWSNLARELQLDMTRLWQRNLGRDDRLVGSLGREGRHPFLGEALVAGVRALPLPLVADLRDAPGTGDKRLLRCMLRMLGLPRAAGREKRAIQFGSRIGKLSNERDFGSQRAANKQNAGTVPLTQLQGQAGGASSVDSAEGGSVVGAVSKAPARPAEWAAAKAAKLQRKQQQREQDRARAAAAAASNVGAQGGL